MKDVTWWRALVGLERLTSAALMVGIFLLVVTQVVARYIFQSPFVWADEMARFFLIWMTFVASGLAAAEDDHISVDVILTKLGPLGRRVVVGFSSLAAIVTSVVLAPVALDYLRSMHRVSAPATGWPMSVVYAAGFVGFLLISFHMLVLFVLSIFRPADLEDVADPASPGGAVP